MARPIKLGLDYFPLDVGFFEDEKILAISGEFSVKGEIVVLRLLCEIYKNGYFVEYSELLKNKLARLGGLSGGLVNEVIIKLVKYGFFDGSIFREHKVLTSETIQEIFFEATKRRKAECDYPYLLVNVNNNPVNVNINTSKEELMHALTTQSKVKESKVIVYDYIQAKEFLLGKTLSIENIAMKHKLSVAEVKNKISEFISQKETLEEKWKTDDEILKNFFFWLPKNIMAGVKTTNPVVTMDYQPKRRKL